LTVSNREENQTQVTCALISQLTAVRMTPNLLCIWL